MVRLTLTLADEATANRAAVILGPAAPGRAWRSFRLTVDRRERPGLGASPALVRRLLARLDREELNGELEPVATETRPAAGDGRPDSAAPPPTGLAAQWDALLRTLPPDWSHLLGEVELDSSDYDERAALLMAPANPSLHGVRALRFRCARSVGYGVSPAMARRCFERVDREGMTGRARIVELVSDAHPVYTQGPVWYLGGRPV